MTSINAVKFNQYHGVLICDEQRGWNEENLKVYAVEKIKRAVPIKIQQRYRLAACYGNTGTSSIGDELRWLIPKRLGEELQRRVEKLGKYPEVFMTIEELAYFAFNIQCQMKHRRVDETLVGKFGFTTSDFIRGSYEKEGKKYEIKEDTVIRAADEHITWKSRGEDGKAVHLNAGIIAGFEPKEGFRIFHLSLFEHICEPVQELYLSDGSGRDMCAPYFTEYFNAKSIPERRGDIDPVEGLITAISAVNKAVLHNVGVGGYFNIILIDGRIPDNEKIMWQIADHRSKLASNIVSAYNAGFISTEVARKAIEDIFYQQKPFSEVYQFFFNNTKDKKELSRFLRGYK